MHKCLLFLVLLVNVSFGSTVVYQAFTGTTSPSGWQIQGTDDNGAKDDTDFFNSGQGFLQLTKEANNEVASAFYTENYFNNVGWTLTADVRIASASEAQDGEGLTICWVEKSLVDAQYATDGNYNFLLGALGPIQGAPVNMNLFGFELDHLYNPGDSKSDEYVHTIQIETTSMVHLTNGAKDFSDRGGTPNTEYYLNNDWISIKLVCWLDGSEVKLTFWWTKDADGGTFSDSRKWEYNYTANGVSYPAFQGYLGITAATNTNKRSSHDIRNVYLQNTEDMSLPVELGSFNARSLPEGIELSWETQSETDNAGFILERKTGSEWQNIANYNTHPGLVGQGTKQSATRYRYLDTSVQPKSVYEYRLGSVSLTGQVEVQKSVSHQYAVKLVDQTQLFNAYPNPFNPSTEIRYQLANDGLVELDIYNIQGQHVRSLVAMEQVRGEYQTRWDGTDALGDKVSSGTFLAKLKTGNIVKTVKLLYIR